MYLYIVGECSLPASQTAITTVGTERHEGALRLIKCPWGASAQHSESSRNGLENYATPDYTFTLQQHPNRQYQQQNTSSPQASTHKQVV